MSGENISSMTDINETTANPRLIPAVGAGLGAALLGAVAWAVITVTTKYQIGFMAVGVGFLVGYAVRTVGRGSTMPFGIAGAILALLGCVLGNVLSTCGFIAAQESISVWSVLSGLDLQSTINLIVATFDGMDLLFYGIAVYEGYKLSFHSES